MTNVSPASQSILHSSTLLPWEGIFCEQRSHLAGEYSYPAFSTHLICLHHGPPSFLEQIGNGQSHSAMMSAGDIQIVPVGTACTWRHPSATGFIRVLLTTEVLQ